MGERLAAALTRARTALDKCEPDSVAKTIWGSPAGKKRLSGRLAALLPAHKTYVEPFAGSAAVLFAKEPTEVEVLNDADPEIAEAYRLVKRLSTAQIEQLRRMSWTGDVVRFKRLIQTKQTGDVERLHRFLYLTHFSYGKLRGRSFSPSLQGVEARTVERIEACAPRLKHVRIHAGDYEKVVREYDGADTAFFLDPPYPGYNVDVGESVFDEERFFNVLQSLKGRFLLTYGIRGKLPELLKHSRFHVKQIRTPRSIRAMRGVGGSSVLTQLLVSNYRLAEKAAGGTKRASRVRQADIADVDKRQAFGTFGGSYHYAKRIVPLIPEHETYVEPFAGAAAVLYAKEPSAREVIADIDTDVVFLHRAVKSMTEERVRLLRQRFEWTCTEESFQKARTMTPRDGLSRFYKLVFVRTHARDCRPDGTHPARNHLGSTTDPAKYLGAAARLAKVTVLQQDYRKTIEQFDGPRTFFFLDPPYPGEWYDASAAVDLDEFIGTLRTVKARFIAVLNDSAENAAAFRSVGHVFRLKVREASGLGGVKHASRLFCANYKIGKADGLDEIEPFAVSSRLIKGIDPDDERYVLGVVLEPEEVDAQGDIYSVEEVRRAAHRFMEEYGGLGLMHRFRVNDQVKVLESFLAPTAFSIGEVEIRKGTWLLAVRILADELWEQVKDGTLTGFSIGGSARREPDGEESGSERRDAA